jgi:hypothetical protein
MACWAGFIRESADKTPLRPALLRINYGCSSRLPNLDKKKLLELVNILSQLYDRILGSDEGLSAIAGANKQ